jgi:hypothetical protein
MIASSPKGSSAKEIASAEGNDWKKVIAGRGEEIVGQVRPLGGCHGGTRTSVEQGHRRINFKRQAIVFGPCGGDDAIH